MFEAKQNAITLSAIQLGGALSLPVFMIGYFLGSHYRVGTAFLQLVIGNSLLLAISLAYLRVIIAYRLITVDMAKLLFGSAGVTFAGVSMLISLLGWSVIQWQFIANAWVSFIHQKSNFLMFVLQGDLPNTDHSKTFLLGLLMVLSVASGLLFDLPTFYRHARTENQGKLSLILLWMVAVLGVECLGLTAANNQAMLAFINQHRLGFVALIGITGFLTNSLNIYSAGMILNRLSGFNSYRAMIFIVILTGMVSVIPIGVHLPTLLQLMGASAETILCVTLSYVYIKGLTLECLTEPLRRKNQQVFFATMIIMACASFSPIVFLKNMVVTVAMASIGLMFYIYRKKQNEAKN